MTFFEKELRKIVGDEYPDATYVGRACYVRLSDMNRAKIQFTSGLVAGNYDTLLMTILNRNEGAVDKLALRLRDVWGKKQVNNPNFRDGISPYIWDDYGQFDWYVYHPTDSDYQQLTDAVTDYLEVFQEQTQTADQQWQQTM